MKKIVLIVLIVVVLVSVATTGFLYRDLIFRDRDNFNSIQSDDSISILFVGNSHVFWGMLPQQVYIISKANGVDILYKDISENGAHLSRSKDEAITELQTGKYDYIVLQDNTRLLPDGMDGFLEVIRLLCDEAKSNGTVPVLFNPAIDDTVRLSNYTEAYMRAADENDAILVNAGGAWLYAFQTIPGVSLYAWDGIHANNAGAFFTACLFAAVLFDINVDEIPVNNRYRGRDASVLAQAAWDFMVYAKTIEVNNI